jgi:hypothetical protein
VWSLMQCSTWDHKRCHSDSNNTVTAATITAPVRLRGCRNIQIQNYTIFRQNSSNHDNEIVILLDIQFFFPSKPIIFDARKVKYLTEENNS